MADVLLCIQLKINKKLKHPKYSSFVAAIESEKAAPLSSIFQLFCVVLHYCLATLKITKLLNECWATRVELDMQ